MASSVLLDTNAAIRILNRSREITLALEDYDRVHLPLVALGELEYGARKSRNRQGNFEAISMLLEEVELIYPDRATAAAYGELHAALRAKGRPIPQNDIWIAATALQHELPLLTRDAHFRFVDHLPIVGW